MLVLGAGYTLKKTLKSKPTFLQPFVFGDSEQSLLKPGQLAASELAEGLIEQAFLRFSFWSLGNCFTFLCSSVFLSPMY